MLNYQLLVSEKQVESFREGLDFAGGFAVEAEKVQHITDISELIRIGQGSLAGSPYAPDQPLYVLHVPASPLTQARQAFGPVHPGAVMGGIVEVPPFDGRGEVTIPRPDAQGSDTLPLVWIEPTRLTKGAKVWRFIPGRSEPELVLVYHGIAWGWEDVASGKFQVTLPSQFIGAMIARPWGTLPAEVEYSDDTSGKPEAVMMVAAAMPEFEEGFEQLPNGLWAKRIAFSEDLDLFALRAMARYNSVPVIVMRSLALPTAENDDAADARALPAQYPSSGSSSADQPGGSQEMSALISPLIVDALLAQQAGFERYTQGVFTALVPLTSLTEESLHEARPHSWDLSGREAITESATHERNIDEPSDIINDILMLLANVAPLEWKEMRLLAQVVERSVHFAAMARTATKDGELSEPQTIPLLPTSILHDLGHLKEVLATPTEGAPITLLIKVTDSGRVNFSANNQEEPFWVDEVPRDIWRAELRRFPRAPEKIPAWLQERLG